MKSKTIKKTPTKKAPAKSPMKSNKKTTPKKSLARTPTKIVKKAAPKRPAAKTPTKSTKKEPPKKSVKPVKSVDRFELIQSALQRLHSSSVPDSVPCRERQFQEIFEFVESKLMDGQGGCMYVSGVPGTGKTTTLNEVQRRLGQCDYLPDFEFLGINAVQLGSPKKFYSHFAFLLTGEELSSKKAFQYLNSRFTDGKAKKKFTILFVDEFDYLQTRNQDILYMLFDWPKQKNSRMVIIAIANTMDLPENSMLKLSSRIAFTRVPFQPYNYNELETILLSRIGGLVDQDVFELDALKLICRKVAGASGDARRVLDISRRAVENAIRDKRTTVQIKDVTDAFQEILNSTKIGSIRSCSIQQKLFLRALVQESRSNDNQECRFIDVYRVHVDLCRLEGEYVPSTTELSSVANVLSQSRLITLEKSNSQLYRRIFLEISSDDIQFALNIDSSDD